MRAIARGIYRPTSVQSMHVETLNLIEFEVIHGRTYPIISSAQVIEHYPNLKSSLKRLAAVNFFTEVLDRIMFENEEDPELWKFLMTLVTDFNAVSEEDVLKLFRQKQKDFLEVLGYAPRVDRCVVCSGDVLHGQEKMVAISPELGGTLCSDCFIAGGRGFLLDKSDLLFLNGGSSKGIGHRHSILDTFFEYTVGAQLASLSFLYQVVKL